MDEFIKIFFKYSIFLDNILFPLIAFCFFLNSFDVTGISVLSNFAFKYFCNVQKKFFKNLKKNSLYTCKQPLMMADKRSERTRDNYAKFIHQFQPETKTLIRKLERILIKLYRQNVSLLFNQICLNESLLTNYKHTHTHTHIYIYI